MRCEAAVRHLFVEDLRRGRVPHVAVLDVVLRGIHVRGGDTALLDPQAIDVVLESKPRREERRQAELVVVGGDALSAARPELNRYLIRNAWLQIAVCRT